MSSRRNPFAIRQWIWGQVYSIAQIDQLLMKGSISELRHMQPACEEIRLTKAASHKLATIQ